MILKKIKYLKRISIIVLGVVIVCNFGCTKMYSEMNTPKNSLTLDKIDRASIGKLFAQAQYWGMRLSYQVSDNLYAGVYSQFFTTMQASFQSDQFEEIGGWSNSAFTSFYTGGTGPATQLKFVEDFTRDSEMEVENAVAKIWRVEIYHRITDYWGPIIYSEFGNGENSVLYDSQEDIYHDFFMTLDEAVSVLEKNTSAKAFGTDDQVYEGNVIQYIKFANSLRLRLAMRLCYIEPGLARSEAEKAINNPIGVIENNSDNALLKSTINNLNKLSTITAYGLEFVMSSTMTSIMNGYSDPRIGVYMQPCCGQYQEAPGIGYVGARNGLPPELRGKGPGLNYSYVGIDWLPITKGGTNQPDRLMEAAEVYFLRAEGALRGWSMGGTAKQLYDMGISASLEARTDASSSDIQQYITSTNIPAAPLNKDGALDQWNSPAVTNIPILFQESADFETKLEQIITQKWLGLFPNSWEAWAERRRTGYPRGYAIIKSNNLNVSEAELMRRLTFVTSEYSSNNGATLKAVELLNGPDENNTRVWWDAKPIVEFPVPTH